MNRQAQQADAGTEALEHAVDRLTTATRSGMPCPPVRDRIGSTDIGLAYAVQQRLVANRVAAGATVVGRKIGLTSEAVQRQMGVDRPDFGVLLDDMDVSGESTVPAERLLQPKVEAEIAFVLGADLDGELDANRVRDSVAYATAAIEIVDSRITGWDITITDTIADNASSGLYVLSPHRLTLAELEPRGVTMRMYLDEVLVSEGDGSACLGDPLHALAWLARTAQEYGAPLRQGQVVLSGALGPMVPVAPGSEVRVELSELGPVSARF